MALEPIHTLNPARALSFPKKVTCQVEQQVYVSHGHVEVRKYLWSRPVEEFVTIEDDVIILHMGLTPHPVATRIALDGDSSPEDMARIFLLRPGSAFHVIAPSGHLRAMHCLLRKSKFVEMFGDRVDWSERLGAMDWRKSGPELEWLLNHICRELLHGRFGRDIAIEALVNTLCVELARLAIERPSGPDGAIKGGLAPWRMQILRERVYAHLPAPSVTELAEICGMEVRHLRRAFKTETGKTISKFVNEVMVDRASRLLTTTNQPVRMIAASLGFATSASFAHSFRHSTGLLPNEVRQRGNL